SGQSHRLLIGAPQVRALVGHCACKAQSDGQPLVRGRRHAAYDVSGGASRRQATAAALKAECPYGSAGSIPAPSASCGPGAAPTGPARCTRVECPGREGVAMAIVKVFNKGYDHASGIGELLHTATVRHAMAMIRRKMARPVELDLIDGRVVPVLLELTREVGGAWG